MARWRGGDPPRIEPPQWYRVYDPAAWDEPDGHEQRMMDGWFPGEAWPPELHACHSERRWQEARYCYRQQCPALAAQEFGDLVNGERRERDSQA